MTTDYTSKAQAFSLLALALAQDEHAYSYQIEAIARPYAVIDELVQLLVSSTTPEHRKGLSKELQGFIVQATDEMANGAPPASVLS